MTDEPRPEDERDEEREGDYRIARTSAAVALTIVTVFILVLDGISLDYQVSEIVVGALLAGIATLLGIEGLSSLRRG